MKTPKNRKKAFRVACANCNATQDALRYACNQCNQRLYSNMEEQEMVDIAAKVASMEEALTYLEAPAAHKGNPYDPVDKAWAAYKVLRPYTYIPGMSSYLDRMLEVLLPIKIRLIQRTLKANWLFWILLVAFPLVTIVAGMNWMVTAMLFLPALVWLFLTLKVRKDLLATRARLAQITSA
jgi:hypothetical protein